MGTAKFTATREEVTKIARVVVRANLMGLVSNKEENRMDNVINSLMDMEAVHCNGCPIDFDRMADAPDLDFAHDFSSIRANLDRETGKLRNNFVPRFAKSNTEKENEKDNN
jgi:hypothetical protein